MQTLQDFKMGLIFECARKTWECEYATQSIVMFFMNDNVEFWRGRTDRFWSTRDQRWITPSEDLLRTASQAAGAAIAMLALEAWRELHPGYF